MYKKLYEINTRPKPFEFYTADELWTNEHTSKMMLSYHLNPDIDASSRNINFIKKSVDWMVNHFAINSNTKLIDFGCGPGLYSTQLAEYKANVTGIDFSKRSIEYANEVALKNNLNIKYITENYLNYKTDERYDLIIMIMCDFCALSSQQRLQLLNNFHKILKPGGKLILDVYSISGFDDKKEISVYEKNLLNGFWSSKDYYCFLNTFKYENDKVVLDKYTIIEESKIKTVYNWLQHFSIDALNIEFNNADLHIIEKYKNVAGESYDANYSEFAVVAEKQ